jgi:uncharacterized membrane protein YadS
VKQTAAKFLCVPFVQTLHSRAQDLFPGIAVCVIVAASAEFLSAHYDTPAMLLALLLGMAVSVLGEEGKTVPGVAFSARALLRLGVAFLGVRVSMMVLAGLGLSLIALTVLSTIAMIAYPILSNDLEFTHIQADVFLGGPSHDVAQGVGAGVSISEETGEPATLVNLIRVSMLATVVLIASLLIRGYVSEQARGKQPPLLPGFVTGFIGLAGLKSFGLISKILTNTLSDAARWLLPTAIAAVGMQSNLKQVSSVGPAAIAFIVLETLFITGFILAGLSLLS